ncbi:MAG TPA: BTAD domain-containing putative transcriptional regulator [Longimicrobium sp.]|nr:BTAD domain-containing putative transcriptional regulator [Longimicrobium sp.]
MNNPAPSCVPHVHLVTLGTPALVGNGTPIPLRKKDLALLVYLRLEGKHGHSRGALAGLLWGNSREENARHSLTQALGRLRARLGGGVLEVGHDRVGCRATLPCDAASLLQAAGAEVDDGVLALCAGEFLAGFHPGSGAEAFETWAEGRRAHFRAVAVSALDRLGVDAEARGDWDRALAAAQRATELDPASEPAHRRMMRAWNAQGHRLRALQHYERLAAWLSAEFETDPEPETAELAERLRSRAASPSPAFPRPEPATLRAPRPCPRPLPRMEPAAHHPAPPVRARVHWAWGGVAGVAVLLALLWNSGALLGRVWAPEPDPADPPPALHPPLAPAGSAITQLDDWLRTDGRWIYYRYELWMPGACDYPTRAVGNWGDEGWTVGSAVHCIDGAWLAVDVERLGERFSIEPETTYCINFRYIADNTTWWGQHGSEGAPGLDSIRVVASDGSYNIGFAVVREGPGRRHVHFTNAYPGPRC